MQIIKATGQGRNEIISLLNSQKLPSEDLPDVLTDFYAAIEEGQLIGLIGMERYGHYGLLRSMVVHPDHRNKHNAESLVAHLEQAARSTGIREMFLLTETAVKYFIKKEYNLTRREDVPVALKQSSEFSHTCPQSAIVMSKQLTEPIETVS